MQVYNPAQSPNHGGRLNAAMQQYQIPHNDWLDLSTGINPTGWPVPVIPENIFNRLPEDDDGLLDAAHKYYGVKNILPIAGSQAAIQLLPQLRAQSKVGVIAPGYQEHAYCWHQAGHEVNLLAKTEIDQHIEQLDVLILISPNNPTGDVFDKEQLASWHEILASKNGWLIVDEAFMDATPEHSALSLSHKPGFIVLRSLGKFFGLAGLRVGFVAAEEKLLNELSRKLGPWSLSNPSRFVATRALNDVEWHQTTQISLKQQSEQLVAVLTQNGLIPTGGTDLFQWICHDNANYIKDQLAQRGILVRHFDQPQSLRFGLPKTEEELKRLTNALAGMLRD